MVTKKRLLIVTGAGASLDFGMPSVTGVGEIIETEAQKWFSLASAPETNLYSYIRNTIEAYWAATVPNSILRRATFEDVLYAIFSLASAYPAGLFTSSTGAFLTVSSFPDINEFLQAPISVGRNELRHLGCVAVDVIVTHFRKLCLEENFLANTSRAKLSTLLNCLSTEFEVAAVTLNYDNILYNALTDIEVGFDTTSGQFNQDRILHRRSWPCMLHLHGSVHFDMCYSKAEFHEIRWQSSLASQFGQNSFGRGSFTSVEGADYPTSSIIAGLGKTAQILRRPFRTYYSELDHLVSKCDAVLFIGYGFGDVHLNIAFEHFRDDRRRPVVIVDKAADDAMTASSLNHGVCGMHIETILRCFETQPHSMRWLGYNYPHPIVELKIAHEFEKSDDPTTPLSIWYDGLMSVCDHSDRLIEALMNKSR